MRVKSNTPLPAIPAYFRVDRVEEDLEVERLPRLSPPGPHGTRRTVGFTARELGDGVLYYETEAPILSLLGAGSRWQFWIHGLARERARIATAVPFYDLAPVRFKVTQLLSKLVLFVMTIRLIRKGLAMCHATTVAADGRAYLLMGFSGTGKSTVASSLLRQGYEFMSDDYLIADADGRVYAYPDWQKPRPFRARVPLVKYLGITRPYTRPNIKICPQARIGPVLILERGPDRIVPLDREEAMRRILLLNLEEISKLWNSPLSPMLGHYAYFYPELDLEGLLARYRACVSALVRRAGPFVHVQSSTPNFPLLTDEFVRNLGGA